METSVLAIGTTDAVSILRVGPFVIKHFRPRHFDYLHNWEDQIAKRIEFSRRAEFATFEVNPAFWYAEFVSISPFVHGQPATMEQVLRVAALLTPHGVYDVKPANLLDTGRKLVLIDFAIG